VASRGHDRERRDHFMVVHYPPLIGKLSRLKLLRLSLSSTLLFLTFS